MEISDEIREKYKKGVVFTSIVGTRATSDGVFTKDVDGWIYAAGYVIYTKKDGYAKIIGTVKDKKKSSLNFILSINKTS